MSRGCFNRILSRAIAWDSLGRQTGAIAVTAGLGVFAALGALVPVSDAGTAGTSTVVEIQPASRVPHGAQALGAAPASAAETGAVVLKPRDPAAVQRLIASETDPRSPDFHHYLAPGAYATRFGPTTATVDAVRAQLESDGLRVTGVSSDRLLVKFSGSASAVEAAFRTGLERYRLSNGKTGVQTSAAVHVPSAIANSVTAVLGLNNLIHPQAEAIPRPSAVEDHPAAKAADFPHPTGSPTPCPDAETDAQSLGGLTTDQIANSYGAFGLYGAGDFGQGQHIAVFELEPFDQSDLQTYDQCYFGDAQASSMLGRVNVIPVDGGQPQGSGSGEAILDIEDVSAIAPQADIDVYEAPNNNFGALDEYATIVDNDTDQLITSSWAECEQLASVYDPGSQEAENEIFEQAAAQGQTVLSAAGDTGDDECNEEQDLLPPADQNPLSALDPGTQPYVLSVGGTTIDDATQPPVERVWNDGAEWGAGGGGISSSWAMPSWQADAPGITAALPGGADYTNANDVETEAGFPVGFCQQNIAGAGPDTACRLVPDVSAQADEFTGAVTIYSDALGGWTTIGGTSSATPIWAALLALVNASASCTSNPADAGGIGFASPLLYAVASNPAEYAASFNDITSGNNDVYGLDNGLVFPAAPGYDLASGLGSPQLTGPGGTAALAANLCDLAGQAGRPTVTGLSPTAGPVAGGTVLTVNGSGFESSGTPDVASVQVGSDSIPKADITVNSTSSLTLTLPPAADTLPGVGPASPTSTPTPAPQDGAGPANIVVTLTSGQSSAIDPESVFQYVDESSSGGSVPSVTGLSPTGGPETSPTPVQIFGSGFSDTTGVTFGGVPASSFTVDSPYRITVTPPAYSAQNTSCGGGLPAGEDASNDICQVQVVVTNANGSSMTEPILPPYEGAALELDQEGVPLLPAGCGCEDAPVPSEFDYAPTPTITGISTAAGPADYASEEGGTVITLHGSGLNPLTLDWPLLGDPTQADSIDLDVVYDSGTEIDLVAPPIGLSVDATTEPASVQTLAGLASPMDATYAGVPTVSSVATADGADGGPATGGTQITITGSGFEDSIAPIMFVDTVPPPEGVPPSSIGTQYSYNVVDDHTITTQTVSQNPAIVDTEVCTVTDCSQVTPADQLTLYPPGAPNVDSVSPASGPAAGGTAVTISGENLGCVTGVFFGDVAAATFTNAQALLDCGSTDQVTATVPPGTVGTTVPVTVTTVESDITDSGHSTTAASFTYTANPAPPTATASPTSLSFGDQTLGIFTAAQPITVTNTGTGSLQIGTASVVGADTNDFLISSDGCSGQTIASGDSCTIDVRFGPSATGPRTATLDLPSNDPASPLQVSLQGTGAPIPAGPPGATGTAGPAGPPGQSGPPGQTGPAGQTGSAGPAGPAGPAGAAGRAGAAGKVELVTCTTHTEIRKIKGKRKRVKLHKCTTKTVTGHVTFTTSAMAAVLSRGSLIYATGRQTYVHGTRRRLLLTPRRPLTRGRYRLTLKSRTAHHARIIRQTITIA